MSAFIPLLQDRNYHRLPETSYHCGILVLLGEVAARFLAVCVSSLPTQQILLAGSHPAVIVQAAGFRKRPLSRH